MAHASTETPRSSPAPETGAPRLEIEPLLTTHRILRSIRREEEGAGVAARRPLRFPVCPVALSALEAVGAIGDARSFPHLARLLGSAPEAVQCGAARAIGMLCSPGGPRASHQASQNHAQRKAAPRDPGGAGNRRAAGQGRGGAFSVRWPARPWRAPPRARMRRGFS